MLGCCLNSFHFLWAILSTSTVLAARVSQEEAGFTLIQPLIDKYLCTTEYKMGRLVVQARYNIDMRSG